MTTEGSVFTCRQGVYFRLPLTQNRSSTLMKQDEQVGGSGDGNLTIPIRDCPTFELVLAGCPAVTSTSLHKAPRPGSVLPTRRFHLDMKAAVRLRFRTGVRSREE
jgi:hypothetical protein